MVDDLWRHLCDILSTILQYGYPIVFNFGVWKNKKTQHFTHLFTFLRIGSGQTSGHYSAMIKRHGWKYISDEYQNSLDPPTHSSKCIFLAYSNKFTV